MIEAGTTFSMYFEENRNSDIFLDDYREYVHEQKQCGFKPVTFRAWMKNHYESELIDG